MGVDPNQLLGAKQYPPLPKPTMDALSPTGQAQEQMQDHEYKGRDRINACLCAFRQRYNVNAVLKASDTYDPDCRIYRFEHDGKLGEQWYYDSFNFHMQDITLFSNADIDPTTDYLTYMSSEGDVYHAWWKGNFREKIKGAGIWVDDTKGYGRMLAICQIGNRLYVSGDGGSSTSAMRGTIGVC